MGRRERIEKATDAEKKAEFERLIGDGVRAAQAAWLSGVDEPAVTKQTLAERAAELASEQPPRDADAEPEE